MNCRNVSRVRLVVALAALLAALAACDRSVPPLVSKATTPVLLLPQIAAATPKPLTLSATASAGVLPPGTGTVRSSPAATAASVLPTATRTPFVTPAQTFRYVVQLDDTLSGIAARFKTTVETLVLLNNLPTDVIIAGQQLVIPGSLPTATGTPRPPTATATKRPPARTYVVRAGDSLSLIAKRYGTTVTILMRYNGLRSEVIVPGQILRIP